MLRTALALLLSTSPLRAASYWENGDFLIPAPASAAFAFLHTGERYGEWRVVGAPGSVAWTSGDYVHDGFTFPSSAPKPSSPWVNLASMSASPTGIMHGPVPTTVGQPYTLTFSVGNVVDPGGLYGTSSTVLVYANARLIGTATNSNGAGTTTQNWQAFSLTFKADSPHTAIAFINGDPPGDLDCGLSNTLLVPGSAS